MSSGSLNAKLFINYRREDTAPYAGRLYDRLTAHFGQEHVFIDIDQIEPGEDFVEAIHRKVGACDIAIVSIGPDWLSVTDAAGKRRLDDPEDFVRMEIVAALQRKIRVIPILVGGARMPRKQDLPEDLAPLSRRNALELSETRFHSDVDRLIEAIEKPRTLPEKKTDATPKHKPVAAVAMEPPMRVSATEVPRPTTAAAQAFAGLTKPNYLQPGILIAAGATIAVALLVWFLMARPTPNTEPIHSTTAEVTDAQPNAETNSATQEKEPALENPAAETEPTASLQTAPLVENAAQKNASAGTPTNEWETIQEAYKPETWLPEVQKNARAGMMDAQFELGVFYEFGLSTLPRDPRQAIRWYQQAAEQGHALANEGLEDLTRASGPTSELEATKLAIRRQSRQQAILNHVLNDLDQKARDAIKNIKGG